MATTSHQVTPYAWTDVGTTPCFIQNNSTGIVRFVIDTAVPSTLSAPGHSLGGTEPSADISLPGQRVYARAESSRPLNLIVSR